MRDLLLGFRQRGFASNVPNRGEPDADDNMEDAGGVQPLNSSSIVVSSVEKTTIKKAGAGTITLDAGAVDSGNTVQVSKLTYKDSEGEEREAQILGTEDVDLGGGVTAINGKAGDMSVIGGDSIRVETDGQTITVSYEDGKEPDDDPNDGGDGGDDDENYCNDISRDGFEVTDGGLGGGGGGWGWPSDEDGNSYGENNAISGWPCKS
jgi:hypothetical protein